MNPKLLRVIEEGMKMSEWAFIGKLPDGKVRTISSFHEHSREYKKLLLIALGLASTPCDETSKHGRLSEFE